MTVYLLIVLFLLLSLCAGACCFFLAPKLRLSGQSMDSGNKNLGTAKTESRYFITGDKHRDFKKLILFCKRNRTSYADTMIILGDSGFNYYADIRDKQLKEKLAKVGITLFCIHGNKENRPQNLCTYLQKQYCGGPVYYEPEYPNILFAKDGGVYTFGEKTAIVLGGAHSVDKYYRLEHGYPWWSDEEPDVSAKEQFEQNLFERRNRIDYIFTHTVPFKYEPREMFLSNQNKNRKRGKKYKLKYTPDIDKTTEKWLDRIENKTAYKRWFCGHYHTDKTMGRIEIMCRKIRALSEENTTNYSSV